MPSHLWRGSAGGIFPVVEEEVRIEEDVLSEKKYYTSEKSTIEVLYAR